MSPSDQIVLAFDTSAAHCAAALVRGNKILTAHAEEMARGQAERLVPLLEDVLSEAGLSWHDLTRLGVGIGPGNFTGIRISVATARGLSLGLNIPALGISTFDGIRGTASSSSTFVPGPRDTAYVQDGLNPPQIVEMAKVPAHAVGPISPADMAINIAVLAANREPDGAPCPLYIRPADAAPSKTPSPVILT